MNDRDKTRQALFADWQHKVRVANIAELKYLQAILPELKEEFLAKRVKVNTNHWLHKMYEEQLAEDRKQAEESECAQHKISSKKRKLLLLLHPDKCNDEDAGELFNKAMSIVEQDIPMIIESEDPIKMVRDYQMDVSDELYQIKNAKWYLYMVDSSYKDLFVDDSVPEKDESGCKDKHIVLF